MISIIVNHKIEVKQEESYNKEVHKTGKNIDIEFLSNKSSKKKKKKKRKRGHK